MGIVIDFNEARNKRRECVVLYNFHGNGQINLTVVDAKTNDVLMEQLFNDVPTIPEQQAMQSEFLKNNPKCFISNMA